MGLALAPESATASCGEIPPLEEHLAQAEVVFVGVVTAVTHEQRTALVDVEEIWRGPELPTEVTVLGGFEDLGFTTADRYFEEGRRYLFAPSLTEGRLEDNACSATQIWSDDLTDLRPASFVTPEPVEGDPSGGIPAPVIGIASAVLAIGAVSILAFRRRT